MGDWEWHATLSGAPQGGMVSPILSSIYLDRLDKFVETVLIPEYTRGRLRRRNLEYRKMQYAIAEERERGDRTRVRELRKRLRSLPVGDPQDPGYLRLHYIRYADDHLLGFTGPKAEAERIKDRLAQFLREHLKLGLSQDKTLIAQARTSAGRFLGYEIIAEHADRKIAGGRSTVNGVIALHVPTGGGQGQMCPYLTRGKPELGGDKPQGRPRATDRNHHQRPRRLCQSPRSVETSSMRPWSLGPP
jgi:hypothetical protein